MDEGSSEHFRCNICDGLLQHSALSMAEEKCTVIWECVWDTSDSVFGVRIRIPPIWFVAGGPRLQDVASNKRNLHAEMLQHDSLGSCSRLRAAHRLVAKTVRAEKEEWMGVMPVVSCITSTYPLGYSAPS